jgi:hypothetical protein
VPERRILAFGLVDATGSVKALPRVTHGPSDQAPLAAPAGTSTRLYSAMVQRWPQRFSCGREADAGECVAAALAL